MFRGREIWPASRFERSATTNNSFLRGRVSPLVIFHARLDGAFIVSSKEGALPPSREMFSRLARCLSRLSTNSSYQSRSWGWGVYIQGPEVIWTIASEHLGRTESSPIPLLHATSSNNGGVPRKCHETAIKKLQITGETLALSPLPLVRVTRD